MLRAARQHPGLLLFVLALAVRAVALVTGGGMSGEPRADERVFVSIATNLADGTGYTMDGLHPTAQRPPVYPIVLAGVMEVLGNSPALPRICNVVTGAASVWLLFLLARRLFSVKVSVLAAGGIALYWPAVTNSLIICSDTLQVFLVCLLLLCCLRLMSNPASTRHLIEVAVVSGIAALYRSEGLLLAVAVGLWLSLLYGRSRSTLRATAVYLLVVGVLVGAWVARNQIVFGRTLLSTNIGQVMLGVYNPITFEDRAVMGTWIDFDSGLANKGEPLSPGERIQDVRLVPEAEFNDEQISMAVGYIRANVRRLPSMMLYKAQRLILSAGSAEALARFPLMYLFTFGAISAAVRERQRKDLWLVALMIIVFATNAMVFYADNRLRLPFDVLVFSVAAAGLRYHLWALRPWAASRPAATATA